MKTLFASVLHGPFSIRIDMMRDVDHGRRSVAGRGGSA